MNFYKSKVLPNKCQYQILKKKGFIYVFCIASISLGFGVDIGFQGVCYFIYKRSGLPDGFSVVRPGYRYWR